MTKAQGKLVAKGIALGAVFVLALYLASLSRESDAIREIVSRFGYAGIFFVSVLSGFNLAVPIPAIAFLPLFLESGFEFGWTLVVVAGGVTLADLLAFSLGHIGRQAIEAHHNQRILSRLKKLRERFGLHPLTALFLFVSLVPFPNEIVLVPLGLLGYRLAHVLPAVILGNVVFSLLYAEGLLQLFSLFG